MSEVPAGGQPLSSSFLEQVQRISALNVFARAIPLWARAHGKSVTIAIQSEADGQVGFELKLPENSTEAEAQELFELMEKSQRLADLQVIVEELRRSGVSAEKVQNYALEGDSLLRQLYPNLIDLSAPRG